MIYQDFINFIPLIIPSAALIIGGIVAVFVYDRFAQTVSVRVFPRWGDDKKQSVILRIEIENKSNVRIVKKEIMLQILEHKVRPNLSLSEFVPFTKESFEKVDADEKPNEWKEPVEIFKTTEGLHPKEVISVERLCPFNHEYLLHVGLQAKNKSGKFGRITKPIHPSSQQWTTTLIVTEHNLEMV